MIKTYFKLTKPGILFGNAVTGACGFALASKGQVNSLLFLAMLLGLSCVIASACVFNNYFDRFRDQKMERTKNRALAAGAIPVRHAILFALLLGLAGFLLLSFFVNLLAAFVALIGFFAYLVLYGIAKYRTTHGTLIGSIAGGVPPVVGYCAVTNQFDVAALLLFTIIALWQMPHFFAIALYRLKDYTAAAIPVLPVIRGILATKIQMLLYIIAFTFSALLPTLLGYTGYAYLITAALLGLAWLALSIKGFKSRDDTLWARQMFRFSLVVVTALCTMLSFDTSSP